MTVGYTLIEPVDITAHEVRWDIEHGAEAYEVIWDRVRRRWTAYRYTDAGTEKLPGGLVAQRFYLYRSRDRAIKRWQTRFTDS